MKQQPGKRNDLVNNVNEVPTPKGNSKAYTLSRLEVLPVPARDRKIFTMWLACCTQQEIAEEVDSGKKTVDDISATFSGLVSENQTAKTAANHAVDFIRPIYNIWKQQTKTRPV